MAETPLSKFNVGTVLKNIDLYIAMIAFTFVTGVTFLFVITRYFYSLSLPGLEEFTVIVFIWFLYFSMMYCMRKNVHIRVNVIDLILPPRLRGLTTIASNLVLLAFNLSMIYFSGRLVAFNVGPSGARSIMLGIPDYVVYAILPFSFAVFSLSVILHIRRDWLAFRAAGGAEPGPPDDTGRAIAPE